MLRKAILLRKAVKLRKPVMLRKGVTVRNAVMPCKAVMLRKSVILRTSVILRAVAGSTLADICPTGGSCDCAQDDGAGRQSGRHQVASHLNPRIGTLSMPSNCGSMSRNASRIVLMCLRTLSRLRPVFTTWYRSS